MITSGFVAEQFKNDEVVSRNPEEWKEYLGEAVCFPRVRMIDGEQHLYVSKGIVDGVDHYKEKARLLVRWVEKPGQEFKRSVESRWLPLVIPIDEALSLEHKKPGSVLARNVLGLEKILGESGLCNLVESSHGLVCLLDTKSRVTSEVKQRISLSRIGLVSDDSSLVLRDLVRLDQEGGEAMAGTFCCRVSTEPDTEWPFTIFAGSLRFMRHWDDCESPVRLALISPFETNYMDAVSYANDLFLQRGDQELRLPDDLLNTKPMSMDIQLMNLK